MKIVKRLAIIYLWIVVLSAMAGAIAGMSG